MNINFGRVALGGLLAGVVLTIGEVVLNDLILASQMEEMMRKFNLSPPGTSFMVVAIFLTLVLGMVIVFMYALIRPRVGPGPKAAIIAGLIAWFCVYVYNGIVNGMLFSTPANFMIIAIVWGLFQYALAAIAGAWLYKET